MTSNITERVNDFDAFRATIEESVINGATNDEIVASLGRQGLQTSTRSLKRQLQAWDIRRQSRAPTDELAEAVNWLFHHTLLNDVAIAERIKTDYDLFTTARQVKSIRLMFGWLRHREGAGKTAQAQATVSHVLTHLTGPGRAFGARWFVTYLRQLGIRVRRDDVAGALRQLNPEAVILRCPLLRKPRLENYTTSGPNFLWCLDGHDKISQYGIEIYAAIDAYSRKIIWYYCGNSNRTAVSILSQYLRATRSLGLCPRFLRTDKGTETVLLADCHFSFFVKAAYNDNWEEEEIQQVRLSDCYWYGPSTRNIRIEGLWRQQRQQTTGPWLRYFRTLTDLGLFRQDLIADRIIFLFLFMPILREELATFVSTHNAHPIRLQRSREKHVPGEPNELYRGGEQNGFTADREVLAYWDSTITQFGKLTIKNFSILIADWPDPDAYLTIETMQWCTQTLASFGILERPRASAFLQQQREIVPDWYAPFLIRCRTHVAAGNEPLLALAPAPDDGQGTALAEVRRRLQLLQQLGYES